MALGGNSHLGWGADFSCSLGWISSSWGISTSFLLWVSMSRSVDGMLPTPNSSSDGHSNASSICCSNQHLKAEAESAMCLFLSLPVPALSLLSSSC